MCFSGAGESDQQTPPNPDDIELRPNARERFIEAVKRVARHPTAKKTTAKGASIIHKRNNSWAGTF
jgi:hypothetical protein